MIIIVIYVMIKILKISENLNKVNNSEINPSISEIL